MLQHDPLAWYPGHCWLETVLFTKDSAQGRSAAVRRIESVVHKRNLPSDTEDQKIHSYTDRLLVNTEAIAHNSLQLTLCVGLVRNAPEAAETHQDRHTLASILSDLNFPEEPVRFALQSPRVGHGRLFIDDGSDEGSQNPVFYATGSRFCTIWRFDIDTKSTRLLIVSYSPPPELIPNLTLMVESKLQSLSHCFGHPMLTVALVVDILRLDAVSPFDEDNDMLKDIEEKVTLESAYRISTMSRLRDLGRLLGHEKFILIALKGVLEQARRYNDQTYADKDGTFNDKLGRRFAQQLDQQRDLLDLDIAFFEVMQQNITHQLTALSTIVNMQDGTSMKTVAIITMTFLPGTFLAAMFAMPVFPKGRDDTFWLYWALCLPLTAVVFIVWLAWIKWHSLIEYSEYASSTYALGSLLRRVAEPTAPKAADKLYDYVRRRLKGDTYAEWVARFRDGESVQSNRMMGGKTKNKTTPGSQSV